MKRVLVVGSARKSGGGVASVIRLHEQMPVWREYGCYWLETQIQAGTLTKLWYALRAAVKGFFLMPRFDMVHFHTVPDQSMTVQLPVLLWAKLWRRKVLLHIHCGNQLAMPMCTNNRIANWCMGQADGIILLAESFKPMLDEYWPEAKGAKRFVLYNPLAGNDTASPTKRPKAYETKAEPSTITKTKTILFAGIFNENKAADVVVRAFAEVLRSEHELHEFDESWKLVLLGSGPEEAKLRLLIRDAGLEDKVLLPGYLFGEAKEEYFRKASIYVMSSHYEGFPMVVLEAWSHETAVVTTPVGGLVDFINGTLRYGTAIGLRDEGKAFYDNESCNALTFDFDDVEGLAKQLQRLMTDEELRSQLAQNGKRLVEERFSMEQINEDLRRIWSAEPREGSLRLPLKGSERMADRRWRIANNLLNLRNPFNPRNPRSKKYSLREKIKAEGRWWALLSWSLKSRKIH